MTYISIVTIPPPRSAGGGGERGGGLSLQSNFQKGGGLERTSTFRERLLGKRGVTFFRGVQFSDKNKLKSDIFNDKKSLLAKIFFSVITKNSNWEILPKNLVLKDKMVLRMKIFNILDVHWKIGLLAGGGSRKINIEGGELPKRGRGLDSLPI